MNMNEDDAKKIDPKREWLAAVAPYIVGTLLFLWYWNILSAVLDCMF